MKSTEARLAALEYGKSGVTVLELENEDGCLVAVTTSGRLEQAQHETGETFRARVRAAVGGNVVIIDAVDAAL